MQTFITQVHANYAAMDKAAASGSKFTLPHKTKESTPDLGELMICFLLIDMQKTTWPKLAATVLLESLIRNVKWAQKQWPRIDSARVRVTASERIAKTFDACRVSQRILMFQRMFIKVFRGDTVSPEVQCRRYSHALGQPPAFLVQNLLESQRQIQAVESFPEFIRFMGLQQRAPEALDGMLRNAVLASRHLGWHRMYN